MTNEEKAVLYGHLLNEHTKISNKIAEIKGQSIDLGKEEQRKIVELQNLQLKIMKDINRLFS